MADNQIVGKSPLHNILGLKKLSKNISKWYTTAISNLVTDILDGYAARNEVLEGGVVTDGTAAATTLLVSTTGLLCILNGRLMAPIAAITTDDLLEVGGATPGVGTPIWSDGTAVTGFTLGSDETVRATLIVCNTDDTGTAPAEADNDTPMLVVILSGTSTAYDDEAHLSSLEIQEALEANGKHDIVTGWAHVAQILWTNPSGVPAQVTTMNRNNVVSEA